MPYDDEFADAVDRGDGAALQEVARGLQDADDNLYQFLWDRYSGMVFRTANRRLSREDAEDVTQEVFVGLFRDLENYDPERGKTGTYLYVTAFSRTMEVLRQRVRRAPHDEAVREETARWLAHKYRPIPPGDRITDDCPELTDPVKKALNEVFYGDDFPHETRQILLACFVEGLSRADIAKELGLEPGTVRNKILRAIKKLKSILETDLSEGDQ